LQAIYQQIDPPSLEIIVPYDARDQEVAALQSEFPGVLFHPVDHLRYASPNNAFSREHHDELRGIGLRLARGKIVALLEDHGRVDKNWAKNVMAIHQNNYAAVGGAIENEVHRLLNWAIYFCDFGRYQNPVPEGPAFAISDANITYKRDKLEAIKDLWADAYHETIINGTFLKNGETLWLSPDVIVYQHRENLTFGKAFLERYVWGRSYAGTLAKEMPVLKRLIYLAFSPLLPFLLTARKFREVLLKKRHIGAFLSALPITFLLLCFWSIGEFVGYATAKPTPLTE